jgi:MOSC domain-containing protein YiiM
LDATVEQLYVTERGGAPMTAVPAVRAVASAGLEGDRYAARQGYWSGVDECEVTLIEAEALEAVAAAQGVRVQHGEHRRNIVTRGVRLYDLAGQRFAVGEAVLVFDRPRPPCRYIATITEPGMTRALGASRGGICARVEQSGRIRVGDAIVVLDRRAADAGWLQRLRATRRARRAAEA